MVTYEYVVQAVGCFKLHNISQYFKLFLSSIHEMNVSLIFQLLLKYTDTVTKIKSFKKLEKNHSLLFRNFTFADC